MYINKAIMDRNVIRTHVCGVYFVSFNVILKILNFYISESIHQFIINCCIININLIKVILNMKLFIVFFVSLLIVATAYPVPHIGLRDLHDWIGV